MKAKSPRRSVVSAQHLRKAASSIQPPNDEQLLPSGMRAHSRQLDAALHRYRVDSPQLRAIVRELAQRDAAQGQKTMGGGFGNFSPFVRIDQLGSYMDFLNGLYVPTNSKLLVLPDHYFYLSQAWQSSLGGTSASHATGNLSNYSLTNVTMNNDSSFAGVYILVKTDQKNYGKLSRVTLEPSGSWNAKFVFRTDWDWTRNVAGSVRIAVRVFLVAYEYNIATNKFEPLLNNSATSFNVLNGTFSGSGEYGQTGSGALDNFGLQFIAEPARQYLLGVVSQVQITHNLTDIQGRPLAPPPQGAYVCYGILNATVESMFVSRKILIA